MFDKFKPLAIGYHGGMSSQLYQVGCSGKCNDLDALILEIEGVQTFLREQDPEEYRQSYSRELAGEVAECEAFHAAALAQREGKTSWIVTWTDISIFYVDANASVRDSDGEYIEGDPAQIKASGVEFEIRDADDVVYFRGYLLGDHNGEDGFIPLDKFGENYGATSIFYKIDGQWEEL